MYGWPDLYINIPFRQLALALTMSFSRLAHQERSSRVDFGGPGLLAVGIGALQTMLERVSGSTGSRRDRFVCSRSRARFR